MAKIIKPIKLKFNTQLTNNSYMCICSDLCKLINELFYFHPEYDCKYVFFIEYIKPKYPQYNLFYHLQTKQILIDL